MEPITHLNLIISRLEKSHPFGFIPVYTNDTDNDGKIYNVRYNAIFFYLLIDLVERNIIKIDAIDRLLKNYISNESSIKRASLNEIISEYSISDNGKKIESTKSTFRTDAPALRLLTMIKIAELYISENNPSIIDLIIYPIMIRDVQYCIRSSKLTTADVFNIKYNDYMLTFLALKKFSKFLENNPSINIENRSDVKDAILVMKNYMSNFEVSIIEDNKSKSYIKPSVLCANKIDSIVNDTSMFNPFFYMDDEDISESYINTLITILNKYDNKYDLKNGNDVIPVLGDHIFDKFDLPNMMVTIFTYMKIFTLNDDKLKGLNQVNPKQNIIYLINKVNRIYVESEQYDIYYDIINFIPFLGGQSYNIVELLTIYSRLYISSFPSADFDLSLGLSGSPISKSKADASFNFDTNLSDIDKELNEFLNQLEKLKISLTEEPITSDANRKKKIKDYVLDDCVLDDCVCCDESEKMMEIPQSVAESKSLSLDDLILLGKAYNCKLRKTFKGLDLSKLALAVKPLEKFAEMGGLEDIKKSVVDNIIYFIKKKTTRGKLLNVIIYGPPGVGKTTISQHIANIYNAVGILKTKNVIQARRSDLIGKYLGETALKTQDVINKAKGGILLIDEVYSLGHVEGRDSYSKECLDTLTNNLGEKEVDFICIVAGYELEIEECFFSVNKGLKRRFPFRYYIDSYSNKTMADIMFKKLTEQEWNLAETDVDLLEEFIGSNQKKFENFIGDIENFILRMDIIYTSQNVFDDNEHKSINRDILELTLDTIHNTRQKDNAEPKYEPWMNMYN